MLYIGLGHYRRTGKDTFANYLVSHARQHNIKVKKISFAWKLKQITHELYSWGGLREPEFYDTKVGEKLREVKLEALICKEHPYGLSPRDIWILFGTPAVRTNVYQDTWLNYVLKTKWDANIVLIPDVRFPNEAEAIKANRGLLIKIVRPEFAPMLLPGIPDSQNPDRALLNYDDWDYWLGTSGSLDDLNTDAESFINWIGGFEKKPVQSPVAVTNAKEVEQKALLEQARQESLKGLFNPFRHELRQ